MHGQIARAEQRSGGPPLAGWRFGQPAGGACFENFHISGEGGFQLGQIPMRRLCVPDPDARRYARLPRHPAIALADPADFDPAAIQPDRNRRFSGAGHVQRGFRIQFRCHQGFDGIAGRLQRSGLGRLPPLAFSGLRITGKPVLPGQGIKIVHAVRSLSIGFGPG